MNPPPSKKRRKNGKAKPPSFHVTLRERKGKPVMAQLKYGMFLISEADPSQVSKLYELMRDWNARGVKLTTTSELRQRQAEALKYVPMADQDLPNIS